MLTASTVIWDGASFLAASNLVGTDDEIAHIAAAAESDESLLLLLLS
jgi:hypothetical protein